MQGRPFIVDSGKPCAQIVIAEKPPRTVRLAATELQTYIQKITGAIIPIGTQEDPKFSIRIYVGRSALTDKLGIKTTDLEHGAFRMLSGENWLALVGADKDFIPKEPYGRNPYVEARQDAESVAELQRIYATWDEITRPYGPYLSAPFRVNLGRQYSQKLDLWHSDMDNAGTFNAVNRFLRDLGVRWYHPGELGEVVPSLSSIALPQLDQIVRPDFANRRFFIFYQEFFTNRSDEILWKFRLGQNVGDLATMGNWSGHGVVNVLKREEMKLRHPEIYKLQSDGKRATDHLGFAAACFSSEKLVEANVQYLWAGFDYYGAPIMTVSPEDGFVSLCACNQCKGKDTPERGPKGVFSDYVWSYISRVAGEIQKTHPNRLIMTWAYGAYTLPPESIEQLPSNVRVGFALPGIPNLSDSNDPTRKLFEQWKRKTPTNIPFVQWNYFLANWPRGNDASPGLPDVQTRKIANYLPFLKGVSQGIYAEVYPSVFSDLNVYVASRFLWDAGQDLDALLNEYYLLFYGPAHQKMKAFFEFCEANWESMQNPEEGPESIARAFTLLEDASQHAGSSETVYQKRITRIASFMEPLKKRREQLLEARAKQANEQVIRCTTIKGESIAFDGKLDEPFWHKLSRSKLRNAEEALWFQTYYPDYAKVAGTTAKFAWIDGALYIGLHCKEPWVNKAQPNIFAQDQSLEVSLKTQNELPYQIVINPNGILKTKGWADKTIEKDRNSTGEAVVYRGENFWSAEIKIPTAAGAKSNHPTEKFPWWLNVIRTRKVRGETVHFSLIQSGSAKKPDQYTKLFVEAN